MNTKALLLALVALAQNGYCAFQSVGNDAVKARQDITKARVDLIVDETARNADERAVRSAWNGYELAVRKFGVGSRQAEAALTRLDEANSALRGELVLVAQDERDMDAAKLVLKVDRAKTDEARRTAEIGRLTRKLPQDAMKVRADRVKLKVAMKEQERTLKLFDEMGPQGQTAEEKVVKASDELDAQRHILRKDDKRLVADQEMVIRDEQTIKSGERQSRLGWLADYIPRA